MNSFETERIATSFHEGGHATMAALLDLRFDHVTIGVSLKYAEMEFPKGDPDHMALVALAGPIVEKRMLRKTEFRSLMSREDRAVVFKAAEADGYDPHEYLAKMAGVAEKILYRPEVNRAVAAVAGALLSKTRLSYAEVKAIVAKHVKV